MRMVQQHCVSGCIEHVTIFAFASCLVSVVGLGLWSGLGLDLVFGWLVVMRTYLYNLPLSLSLPH